MKYPPYSSDLGIIEPKRADEHGSARTAHSTWWAGSSTIWASPCGFTTATCPDPP